MTKASDLLKEIDAEEAVLLAKIAELKEKRKPLEEDKWREDVDAFDNFCLSIGYSRDQFLEKLLPEYSRTAPVKSKNASVSQSQSSSKNLKKRNMAPKVYDWVLISDPTKGFCGAKPIGAPQPWHHRKADNSIDMAFFRKPDPSELAAMQAKLNAWKAANPN